ncbi:uncharacterized protein [Heptranchias perlo]|uniref:uncharacterized protein isoform X2 n=1 Tax=Heptranchias perlo TaxID=212740 RepID=UPI00355A9EE3
MDAVRWLNPRRSGVGRLSRSRVTRLKETRMAGSFRLLCMGDILSRFHYVKFSLMSLLPLIEMLYNESTGLHSDDCEKRIVTLKKEQHQQVTKRKDLLDEKN